MPLTPQTLTRHEIVGLPVRVVDAPNPDLVGIEGRVRSESRQTLVIRGPRGQRIERDAVRDGPRATSGAARDTRTTSGAARDTRMTSGTARDTRMTSGTADSDSVSGRDEADERATGNADDTQTLVDRRVPKRDTTFAFALREVDGRAGPDGQAGTDGQSAVDSSADSSGQIDRRVDPLNDETVGSADGVVGTTGGVAGRTDTDAGGGNAAGSTDADAGGGRAAAAASTDEAADRREGSGSTFELPWETPGTGTARPAGKSGGCEDVVYVTVDGTRLLSRPADRTERAGDSTWQSD
jgi:ribonuclease P protein subunit POP4